MKRIFLNSIAVALLSTFACTATAQELHSSYFMKTSMYRHQMNPALLETPYIAMPMLGNVNVGTTGTNGMNTFLYKTQGNDKYKLTTFMSPEVSASEFLGKLQDKTNLNLNVNMSLFSVGFRSFKGISVVELNLRSNTSMSVPREMFEFMKTAGAKENYTIKDLNARTNSYMELAVGHSHQIGSNWKVGGKLKFLIGVAYADLKVDQLDLTMNDTNWKIKGNAQLSSAILKSDFKYEDDEDAATFDSSRGGKKIKGIENVKGGVPGLGMAIDFGAAYKVESVEGLTVSAALTDLGFIAWTDAKSASSKGDWTFDGFKNPIYATGTNNGTNKLGDQFDAMRDDLKKMFSLYDDGKKSKTSGIGTTVTLGAEYVMPFYRNLSAGIVYSQRFGGVYSYSQTMLSANIRPLKWIEATLNASTTTEGWCCGGMLSFYTKGFNFFIGSDRFMGKMSKQGIPLNSLNGSVNFGINFPL